MKNTKKGFTLVELLVVIAIVAILATVAIIGYTSFMKKADLSNDQSAIAQMNTALQAAAVPDGFVNPSDAIDALYNVGWNLGKMQPYSNGYHYAYNHSENKMYLLDEDNNVVYPEETDKSKLWGFYYDAVEGKLSGITNYIAMTNITNANNFEAAFGDGSDYQLDMNGYYIKLGDGRGIDKVTVDNGAYISGNVAKNENVKTYTVATSIAHNTAYSYVVFEDIKYQGGLYGSTFDNCIFYNSSIRFERDLTMSNCTFVGGIEKAACVDLYANTEGEFDISITNCTFDNVTRPISIANGVDGNSRDITISGCVFNGASDPKYLIQIADTDAKVTISNCKFNDLGAAATVVRLHNAFIDEATANSVDLAGFVANNLVISNNTIDASISEDKYVDTDERYNTDWDNAVTNIMK